MCHTYYVLAGKTSVLVHNECVTDSNGVTVQSDEPTSVTLNQKAGDGFRDDVVEFLRTQGKSVETDAQNRRAVTFRAPRKDGTIGNRILDMRVVDENGNVSYVETKWGGAGDDYHGSDQEFQDNWLRQNKGISITVVMGGQ